MKRSPPFDVPHKIYAATDKLLVRSIYSLVNLELIRKSLREEVKYYESGEGMDGRIEAITTWLSTLQVRASASISHISIMLGVTIVLAINVKPQAPFAILILFEVCFYVYVLLGCHLVFRSLTLNDGVVFQSFKGKYKIVLIRRFAAMQVVNSLLIVATLGFFLIIVISVVLLIPK